jgi:hypothetical protein
LLLLVQCQLLLHQRISLPGSNVTQVEHAQHLRQKATTSGVSKQDQCYDVSISQGAY